MKCLICSNYSLEHICKHCQRLYLTPELFRQKLTSNIDVLSFYRYDAIKPFLHTKHTDLGYHIFKILAKNSLKRFAKEFSWESQVASIAIDDNPKHSYSHTAILNHALKSHFIQPYYAILRSTNEVHYSGKSKTFRKQNPRKFAFKDFPNRECIVIDDIITTGTTLKEAVKTLQKRQKEVLFCLTLAH